MLFNCLFSLFSFIVFCFCVNKCDEAHISYYYLCSCDFIPFIKKKKEYVTRVDSVGWICVENVVFHWERSVCMVSVNSGCWTPHIRNNVEKHLVSNSKNEFIITYYIIRTPEKRFHNSSFGFRIIFWSSTSNSVCSVTHYFLKIPVVEREIKNTRKKLFSVSLSQWVSHPFYVFPKRIMQFKSASLNWMNGYE